MFYLYIILQIKFPSLNLVANPAQVNFEGRNFVSFNSYFMQFVQTELASKMDPKFINMIGGFMSMEMVVKGKFKLHVSVDIISHLSTYESH